MAKSSKGLPGKKFLPAGQKTPTTGKIGGTSNGTQKAGGKGRK